VLLHSGIVLELTTHISVFHLQARRTVYLVPSSPLLQKGDKMNKALLAVAFVCGTTIFASAQSQNPAPLPAAPPTATPVSTKIITGSTVYITPMDGFETYLAAALGKKKVQLVAVMEKEQADYVISGTSLDKKAGWAKIVFMGNVHSDNSASITMSDRKTGAIVYAYAVDKKSTMHGQQTTAEACAKHLKAHMEGKD
jgi:hypothetical protein